METTKVGIREFRAGLSDYLASDQPVAITRHGQTVGYFIPAHGQAEADLAALRRASVELSRLVAARAVEGAGPQSKPTRHRGTPAASAGRGRGQPAKG